MGSAPGALPKRCEGEKRFPRRAHNPETVGSTPTFATTITPMAQQGKVLDKGNPRRGLPDSYR